MSIMINMIKARDNLSVSEKTVLDYLVKNRTALKDLSVESIAKNAFTSPATVVRMCKKLGYEGFKEFKIDFILANTEIVIPSNAEYKDLILVKDKSENIGRSAIENDIRALEDTLRLYSEKKVQKAAEMIMNSRKIFLFAKGSSYLVCKDFEMKLRRIDKMCTAQQDLHEHSIDSAFLDERDIVILISNSGDTPEVIEAALQARENNVKIISIVSAGKTTLGDLSTVVLYTSALEGDFRSAAMTSRTSQMAVIDALYSHCAYYNIERSISKLEKTYKIFKKFKTK